MIGHMVLSERLRSYVGLQVHPDKADTFAAAAERLEQVETSDYDELLARAESELASESGPSRMHYGDSTKRELYNALRDVLKGDDG